MDLDVCALNRPYRCIFVIWVIAFVLIHILGCIIFQYSVYAEKQYLKKLKKDSRRRFNANGEINHEVQKPRKYKLWEIWHKKSMDDRVWLMARSSIRLSIVVAIFGAILVMHRRNNLLHGKDLTDEQRDYVTRCKGPLTFPWQRKAFLEAVRSWREKLNKNSTTLPNTTMQISLNNTLDQMPKEQNHTDEFAEPKIAALREAQFSAGAGEIFDECLEKFQQLVGYKVQYYISQKSPTFNVTGNLNFWQYFQLQSQYRDLSHLRRSVPFEDDKTIEDVFFLSDTNPVRLSADNQFLLYDSLIDGPDFEQLTNTHKVTIATQTSMDRLFTFIESYERWTGPISAAVFLNGPLEYFLLRSFISHLKLCHPKLYRQTRFSVATPIKNPIPRNILIETETFKKFDCKSKNDDINVVFKKKLEETIIWLQVKYYPQNMMRNLARANIKTDYHLTLDVDIVPCVGMSEKLNHFLNETYIASALVIPTYEISRKISFPPTKRELVNLTKKKLAQPFHKDVFATNQNATNFAKWERVHDSFEEVHVVHEVQQFPVFYEPFFVELQSNPLFDETFVGYGFTRSSHAFEVFVRNGKFLVLSPIFTAELGIKKVKDWSSFRQEQNESNRKRFNHFIANLTSQFPDVQKVENVSSTSYYLHKSGNQATFV